MKLKNRIWPFAAVAFLVTALAFSRSTGFEFIGYDDPDYVTDNAHMAGGLTSRNVAWAFFNRDYASNWHPLAWLSLQADVTLARAFGCDLSKWDRPDGPLPRVMHAHSVVLHALNAALLLVLMAVLTRRRLASAWLLGLALLWSLHPLRVEAVCWVSERKELVSVMWMLVSLLCYCGGRRTLALVPAAFAMMAKPVAVTLPAILVAWDWAICGRVRWPRAIPFAILSAFACYMTLRAQTVPMDIGAEQQLSVRLMSVFAAPVIYLRQTFWPAGLSLLYANTAECDWALVAAGMALVLALAAICVLWLVRKGRATAILTFGIAWSYVGLVPMLGFVKVASQEHSDRYTYWVGCGLVAALALLADELKGSCRGLLDKLNAVCDGRDLEWRQVRKAAMILLFSTVVVLAVAADRRSMAWRDALTLYRDTMSKSWHPFFADAIASMLMRQGESGKAEAEYWLRGCAEHCPCEKSRLFLAEFLLTKPPERRWDGSMTTAYGESESLIRSVLETDPANDDARRLLKEIGRLREEISKKEK